jgi:NTP pyrophosphatase (non-canonical NTP hydrolase)
MSIEDLEKQVIKWAWDRGIFPESTEQTRFDKFYEEVEELTDTAFPDSYEGRDLGQVKMEAGDVIVTMINILHPYGLDLEMCLSAAYEKIKNRTGKMVDGQFVKQEDLK